MMTTTEANTMFGVMAMKWFTMESIPTSLDSHVVIRRVCLRLYKRR